MSQITLSVVDLVNNPLPAGTQINCYTTSTKSFVVSGYLGSPPLSAGQFTTTSLAASGVYYAQFYGGWLGSNNQGITSPSFNGSTQTITLSGFISPVQSQLGYTSTLLNLLPRDWYSNAAQAQGGNAYAVMYGLASGFYAIDTQNQLIKQAQFLQTAQGQSIDSWAAQYFGLGLPRNPGELDAAYRSRIIANLSARKGTTPGIITIASNYGSTIVTEPMFTYESGAFDTNGTIAFDTNAGGFGDQNPLIEVWVTSTLTPGTSGALQAKSDILASKPAGVTTNIYLVQNNDATQL